jgi:hypothetical protein
VTQRKKRRQELIEMLSFFGLFEAPPRPDPYAQILAEVASFIKLLSTLLGRYGELFLEELVNGRDTVKRFMFVVAVTAIACVAIAGGFDLAVILVAGGLKFLSEVFKGSQFPIQFSFL